MAGSLPAALPVGFPRPLAGRALQGVGMGPVPLAIATARDAPPPEKARAAVATLIADDRGASASATRSPVSLAESTSACTPGSGSPFWPPRSPPSSPPRSYVPAPPHRATTTMDSPARCSWPSGMRRRCSSPWRRGACWGWGSLSAALAVGAVVLLGGWVAHSLRSTHPLVRVSLVKDRGVLVANLTTMVGGVGTYLLIALVTRYVQTPGSAGYGFGASIVVTGLLLVPFSAASLLTGRLVRMLGSAATPARMLPLGCLLSFAGLVCFLLARSSLWGIGVMMALAGLGVGVTFAVTPGLIVGGVPAAETGSAMSFNQVVKYIGYSTGSALSAVVLQAATAPGSGLPTNDGYRSAGLVGCAAFLVTGVLAVALTRFGVRPRPSVVAAARGAAAEASPEPSRP
ncbi:MFS transporter [Streptomyces sp. KL116D]|uniref:MFS transporter n=1 Tax=Streptomyces sp. KL116D TaxID=3045152 RepID=UPI0035579BFB